MKNLFLSRILLLALITLSASGTSLALASGHPGGMGGFGLAFGYPLGLLLLVGSTLGLLRVKMAGSVERRALALLACLGILYAVSRWPPKFYNSDSWRAPGENFLTVGLCYVLILFLAACQEYGDRKRRLGSRLD